MYMYIYAEYKIRVPQSGNVNTQSVNLQRIKTILIYLCRVSITNSTEC
jgi:hypothetical protein